MANETAPRRPASGDRFAMRALWRLAAWGGAAAFALCAVAITVQSQTGSQRLALLLTPAELPVRPVATVKVAPPQPDETARLTAQLHVLAADRDQLSARVKNLEHQLDDMTGSIKQLAARPAPEPIAKAEPAPAAPATAPPMISPLAMPPLADAAAWPAPQAPPETSAPEAAEADTQAAEATGSVSAAPAEPHQQAAPPVFENVPLPPVRIATAEPGKPQFALALAGASSLELTRIQWTMLQANFTKLLAGLEPRALSERRGTATHYRLLAGPLPTQTEAAKLCARLIAAHASCRPVQFGGDPL